MTTDRFSDDSLFDDISEFLEAQLDLSQQRNKAPSKRRKNKGQVVAIRRAVEDHLEQKQLQEQFGDWG